ncbi:hypothetical protein Tco_0772638 [Tanacetum coccineum]|uniref:Uncharacterized protein n=1 Tax=Tanacetum coccineum TaxID=301880 RepID=A0ABQ4ZJG7_9ASTR
MPYGNHRRRPEHKPTYRTQEHHAPYVPPHRPNQEFHRPMETRAVLTLDSLVSTQEILATKHQLHLPQPAPLVGIPSKEKINKYCDYHNEKGHSTNDCFHLKILARDSVRIRQVESSGEGCKAKGKRGTTEQRFAERQVGGDRKGSLTGRLHATQKPAEKITKTFSHGNL